MAAAIAGEALTVYVVDDEATVRSVLSRILVRDGFNVQAFSDAQQARTAVTRAALMRAPVDVVLLDMALEPESESTAQAEELLRILTLRQPRPEIILMSGHLSSDEFFHFIMKGATDYVAKPWTTSDLLQRVRYCAARGRQKYLHYHSIGATSLHMQRDAFLSYSSHDTELALGLRRVLERMGISTWYAPADLRYGETWPEALETAIGHCAVFIVLVTPRSLESAYVTHEVSRAVARRDMEREHFLLVPVLYGMNPAQLPESLRTLMAVDLTNQFGLADAVIKLADRISQFVETRTAVKAADKRRSERRVHKDRRDISRERN